jgi:hypothetical protein
MAKRPADTPRREPDADTANPHRAEPAPPPEEGLRPEADPALARPQTEEPNGPVGGLVHAAVVEAAQEAPFHSPAADAEAAFLGVEEEGVESSQIFGLMLATVASIVCLVLSLYFIFYLPKLSDTTATAEDVPADRYVEQRELRAEAENLLSQYAVNPEAAGRYRIPIGAAMQQTARAYGGRGDSALAGPVSRADFNLTWISLSPPPAVASADDPGAALAPEGALPGAGGSSGEPAVAEGAAPALPNEQ